MSIRYQSSEACVSLVKRTVSILCVCARIIWPLPRDWWRMKLQTSLVLRKAFHWFNSFEGLAAELSYMWRPSDTQHCCVKRRGDKLWDMASSITTEKQRSKVWEHFDLIPPNKVEYRLLLMYVLCPINNIIMSVYNVQELSFNNNTSSMLRHLCARHGDNHAHQANSNEPVNALFFNNKNDYSNHIHELQ